MVLDIHTHLWCGGAVVPATVLLVTPVVTFLTPAAFLFTFLVVPGVVWVRAAVIPPGITGTAPSTRAVVQVLFAPVVIFFPLLALPYAASSPVCVLQGPHSCLWRAIVPGRFVTFVGMAPEVVLTVLTASIHAVCTLGCITPQ